MNQGFNLIEDEELEENGLNSCDKLSIIQMFRYANRNKFSQWNDYCVTGLETLIIQTEDYDKLSNYLDELLDENARVLVSAANTFQIEIDTDKSKIEEWGKPSIVSKSTGIKYSLFEIFNPIEMAEDNPNWYHSPLNQT